MMNAQKKPDREDLRRAIEGGPKPAENSAPPSIHKPPPLPVPKTFKQTLPDLKDQELTAHYMGKNVQKRNFAAQELERRHPGKNVTKALDIQKAAEIVNTNPSGAQKDAGNYQKGHVNVHGLDVTIENPRGSTRSGTMPSGESWKSDMPNHYGYIRRTTGADGDQVDVYLGDDLSSESVFVVDQMNPETGKFDEHKVLLGFKNIQAAVDGYDKSFSDGKGEARIGGVTIMTVDEFKKWLKSGDTKKPLSFEDNSGSEADSEETAAAPPDDAQENAPADDFASKYHGFEE